ncbi:CRISPR-associated protein Csb2 [Desulfomicrobium apsheronum]|uniref:CRISPR-associated protein Csb2 n=1 Tax=Desulfomicrobium apsheronum TaxID=52560 RepID=A0A1I3WHR9_9BACT|nr:type I-U CRISPR-associated protein Csb2 [Desulfomicrobium apsheronum]SFK06001.1 CRISPR-associated protein Csb2 [Desulfomicrobium apsheronum]
MPTIIMTFPGRRYHATPWGHHVNEGLIEWPPSPWRLLRALLSVGYTKCGWSYESLPDAVRSLFEKLASVMPTYMLPAATGAHTRHYMPVNEGRAEKRTLVFDTWAQIDAGCLAVSWDVELTEEEIQLLAALADHLGYLGRAESWVEARLEKTSPVMWMPNCYPNDSAPGFGWEQVSVFVPLSFDDYENWINQARDDVIRHFDFVDETKPKLSKEEKKIQKARQSALEKAMKPYPKSLFDALHWDTADWKQYRWIQAPGSKRVLYWRKSDALQIQPMVTSKACSSPSVKIIVLAMATAQGNKHALPPVVHTLIHGERLHKLVLGKIGQHHTVLSGCDENASPLKGMHEHAHILPLDLDDDGHLDHFTIWAPAGLDAQAERAFATLRNSFSKGLKSLHIAIAATCREVEELIGLPGEYGEALQMRLGLQPSCDWMSHTPFVPPRYLKKSGRNTLQGQIMAECDSRGLPVPVEIELLDPRGHPILLRQRHFSRKRKFGPQPPVDCSFSVRIQFNEPVRGPICLGYGSHFGLGLFSPLY